MVAGRCREPNSFAGRPVLTGWNAFDFATETRDGFGQFVQSGFAVHFESVVVHPWSFRLAQDDTVMIMLVPRLQTHSALLIAIGLN